MKKVCKKRILMIFSIIMVSFVMLSFFAGNVSAEVNPETSTGAQLFADILSDVIGAIGNNAFNSIFAGVATLVGILALVLFLGVGLMFSSVTGSIFPAPDNIIFNRIAILDVNFFNPNKNSIIGMAGDVIPQLYNSFHTIATSIFIIAAMIVGIKMALSSVASEKAQAKSALVNWLIGVLVLFLMRLIIAGIFELNEYIVWKISVAANTEGNVSFAITIFDAIPILGNTLESFLDGIDNVLKTNLKGMTEIGKAEGYSGMLLYFALGAWSGDIFSAILLFVLFGQTITLFVAYGKRLMYSIILGLVAPLVVAIDTINKSLKGQSTILSNWFKEFTGTVFIQIFHSLLLFVTLKVLSEMVNNSEINSTAFVGIAAIVLTSGIVKFEKLYKQIFGMSDGLMGGLKGSAGKVISTIEGAKSATRALGDNKKKWDAADSAKKKAQKTHSELMETRSELVRSRGKSNAVNALETVRLATQMEKDPVRKEAMMNYAKEFIQQAKADGYNPDILNDISNLTNGRPVSGPSGSIVGTSNQAGIPITNNNIRTASSVGGNSFQMSGSHITQGDTVLPQSTVNSGNFSSQNLITNNNGNTYTNSTNASSTNSNTGNSSGITSADANAIVQSQKELASILSKIQKEMSIDSKKDSTKDIDKKIRATDDKIIEAKRNIAEANKNIGSAALATFMGPANLAAGIGFGLGAGDDMSESTLKGGKATQFLDWSAEKIGAQIGKQVASSVSTEVRNGMKRFDRNSNVGDI